MTVYCGRCGTPGSHPTWEAALALEPPRYCPHCGRRLAVQVLPAGYLARCTRHGDLTDHDVDVAFESTTRV